MEKGGRVPPQAVEIEEEVLGAMLMEEESVDIAISMLSDDDFYKPANRKLYSAMVQLYHVGEAINILTVENELRDKGELDVVGGSGYLTELTRSVASAANLEYCCTVVIEKSLRRQLIQKCNEVISQAYESSTDTSEVIDYAQKVVFSLTEDRDGVMSGMVDVMTEVMKNIQSIQEEGKPIGLRCGLDLDNILQGFQDSKLYFLGARPSMGKTALAMTIIRRIARDGHSAGILSLETSRKSLGIRLLAQVANIPADELTSGQLSEQQMQLLMDAASELSELGIFIDDEPALSVQKVRSKCRLMAKKGASIIFVDYLTLIKADGRTKHEEVGEITKTLKQVCKELDMPIVTLAQLSRKVEDRNDKRPQMSDLRESGSIEEDADAIMFLYRPEYYGVDVDSNGNSTKGIAEVIIAKNKDGKVGMKRQRFVAEYMRFENVAYQQEETPKAPLPQNSWYDNDNNKSPF